MLKRDERDINSTLDIKIKQISIKAKKISCWRQWVFALHGNQVVTKWLKEKSLQLQK